MSCFFTRKLLSAVWAPQWGWGASGYWGGHAESQGVPAVWVGALLYEEEGAVMYVCVCVAWQSQHKERGFTGCVPERSRCGAWFTHPIDSSAVQSGGAAEQCHRDGAASDSSSTTLCRPKLCYTFLWKCNPDRRLCCCHGHWGWLIRKAA